MDNIFIYSSTFEDHLSHVIQVLQTLKIIHLKMQIDKCQFTRNSVECSGHLIPTDRTGPNNKNIEAVTSFPTPAEIKDVRAFLGNYSQRFFKNYLVLAGPILVYQDFLSRLHRILRLVEMYWI